MGKLNRLRVAARNRLILCIVGVAALGLAVWRATHYFHAGFLAMFAGSLFAYPVYRRSWERFRSTYKHAFVPRALESVFTDVVYNPRIGIPYDTIADTKMIYTGTGFHAEDYVCARYKGTFFEQSDVLIQQSNGRSNSTLFRGRWMIFNFNKSFKADLQIVEKGFGCARHRQFFADRETRLKKVPMESEVFNEAFRVYAQNEHDAFYIITPALMERLLSLAYCCHGKLMLCFSGSRLHVAINDGRDFFEPESVFQPVRKRSEIWKTESQLRAVTQMIDLLSLDNDLFLPPERKL